MSEHEEGTLTHIRTNKPTPRSANQFMADLISARRQHDHNDRYQRRHGVYPYGDRGIGDELIAAGKAKVIK